MCTYASRPSSVPADRITCERSTMKYADRWKGAVTNQKENANELTVYQVKKKNRFPGQMGVSEVAEGRRTETNPIIKGSGSSRNLQTSPLSIQQLDPLCDGISTYANFVPLSISKPTLWYAEGVIVRPLFYAKCSSSTKLIIVGDFGIEWLAGPQRRECLRLVVYD